MKLVLWGEKKEKKKEQDVLWQSDFKEGWTEEIFTAKKNFGPAERQ